MIDVTFLLLVFFLLTLQFRTLEGKLSAYLPEDQGSARRELEPKEDLRIELVVVDPGLRVDRVTGRPLEPGERGPYELLGRRIAYRVVGRNHASLGSLAARLATLPSEPSPRVVVLPHAGVLYGDVVGLIDVLTEAGFLDVRFALP